MDPKKYTKEEIEKMSYFELWGKRRELGLWYYTPLFAIYTFLIYAFIKIIYIFAKSNTLEFKIDLWIIPICLLSGPLYYLIHELYYKNVYLKQQK